MSADARHVIFPAGPRDAMALGQLHVKTWREAYPGLLPQAYLNGLSATLHARRFHYQLMRAAEGEIVLVAEDDQGLAGYSQGVMLNRRLAEVHTLYLLRRAQGVGMGRALLAAQARALAAHGAERLMLWVLRDNVKARGFYAHLGGVTAETKTEPTAGGTLPQVAYRWDDISVLAGLPA
jgi:GNAT superfamily N-acetyltransferase